MIVKLERKYLLLLNEASLTSSLLGEGLTSIRKYSYAQEGYLQRAFFLLTNGLERLLKLILIYDYSISKNEFPDNIQLRRFGHNLKKLMNNCYELSNKYQLINVFSDIKQDVIYTNLLDILSDFAVEARYYNLDNLSRETNKLDPLKRWNDEVISLILKKHLNKKVKEEENKEKHMDPEIRAWINHFRENRQIELKQKFSMFYVYNIIRACCLLFYELEKKINFPVVLSEYFVIFMNSDKNYIKKRRIWDRYKP